MKKSDKIKEELEFINLDDTSGWSKLEVEGIEYLKLETESSEDYAEEPEEEPEEDEGPGLYERLQGFFAGFHTMDKVIALTGFLILLLGIVTVGMFSGKKAVEKQVAALAPIGEQLETVGILGADTLVAVADARKAMEETAKLEEELLKEYEEEELSSQVDVLMKLNSVQKDLKIKFVNEKSGKLIGNIVFEVKITDVDGKTYNKKDEDRDGIIYLTDLKPGNYQVSCIELTDFPDYSFDTAPQKVKVKETIDYQKIDVSDEIKKESEVDLSKEDTGKKQETEGTLTDTVEWVESTKTAISQGTTYVKINKSEIATPAQQASLGMWKSFIRTAALTEEKESENPSDESQGSGDSAPDSSGGETQQPGQSGSQEGENQGSQPGGSEGGQGGQPGTSEGGAQPGQPGTPEGGGQPSQPGTPEGGDQTEQPEPPGGSGENQQPPAEIPVDSITLSAATLSLEEGKTATLTAVVLPDTATNKTVTYTNTDSQVASIDANGLITALKAGQTTITAKAGEKTASCTVTVTAKPTETKLTINTTALSLKTGETASLVATVTPAGKPVSWSSSNPAVATVENGKVTAVGAGQTTVTAAADGKSVACTVTVTAAYDPKKDTTKNLTTTGGQQVYYYSNGQYLAAKVADYYKYDTFYRQEASAQYRYTGWQNLDGKTYFFDKSGNKVTGEQVIQGAKYNFNSDGSLNTGSGVLGIDVSTWNGNIDWNQVKNAGVSYVIIRTGFRGSTQGALIEDAKFKQNIQGATAAGLKVGVYFFTQAVNEVEAVEEASMVLNQIRNYKISYPVFIDVESSGGRADGLDSATRTKVINAFCQTIQNSGYRAGIYANKTWLNQKMNISALSGYKIWLAQYNTQVTYSGRYDMWQYSDKGRIPGISTNVDMNLSYMGY